MTKPILPLVDFIVNQDYIEEFLCINKDNKELNCKGKCYLMQQLEKENESKRQNLPPIVMEEYPIGFITIPTISFQSKLVDYANHSNHYQNNYHYLLCGNSFHPPNFIG